ncbi:hypothetical protein EX30DRAFT_360711 [Ascodesmis nigricans]|uniref:Uncharacterized protein n=1 Tax=Ascodesmis nigricans TaxID=341454 RepID=A0A4S2N651_9PEZI|nr:hypothetical protein EX30DRAFT_360711 [Ascodesmis nigricans]
MKRVLLPAESTPGGDQNNAEGSPNPEAKTRRTSNYRGRLSGAQSFTFGDKVRAFDVIRQVKPIEPIDWDTVSHHYGQAATSSGRRPRDAFFLKQWFEDLSIRNIPPNPNGKATLPWDVKQAWDIRKLIEEAAHVGTLCDNSSPRDTGEIYQFEEPEDEGERQMQEAFDNLVASLNRALERLNNTPAPASGVSTDHTSRHAVDMMVSAFQSRVTALEAEVRELKSEKERLREENVQMKVELAVMKALKRAS